MKYISNQWVNWVLTLVDEISELERKIADLESVSSEKLTSYSQGQDLHKLDFLFNLMDKRDSYRSKGFYNSSIEVLWDKIFARISPFMIDETSDRDLNSTLSQMIEDLAKPSLQNEPSTTVAY